MEINGNHLFYLDKNNGLWMEHRSELISEHWVVKLSYQACQLDATRAYLFFLAPNGRLFFCSRNDHIFAPLCHLALKDFFCCKFNKLIYLLDLSGEVWYVSIRHNQLIRVPLPFRVKQMVAGVDYRRASFDHSLFLLDEQGTLMVQRMKGSEPVGQPIPLDEHVDQVAYLEREQAHVLILLKKGRLSYFFYSSRIFQFPAVGFAINSVRVDRDLEDYILLTDEHKEHWLIQLEGSQFELLYLGLPGARVRLEKGQLLVR